jgi:hypothetical protein
LVTDNDDHPHRCQHRHKACEPIIAKVSYAEWVDVGVGVRHEAFAYRLALPKAMKGFLMTPLIAI